MTIFINTTNILKNHDLILFCHGFFSTIEKETIAKINQIKRKKVQSFFKKERKNQVWKSVVDQLDVVHVDKNLFFTIASNYESKL
jgi:hypothetical protein